VISHALHAIAAFGATLFAVIARDVVRAWLIRRAFKRAAGAMAAQAVRAVPLGNLGEQLAGAHPSDPPEGA
jgi:hypothetical protein